MAEAGSERVRNRSCAVLTARSWAAFGPHQPEQLVPRVRKVLQTGTTPYRPLPANSGKSVNGKEGVAGSSPAEGFGSAARIASVRPRSVERPRPLRVQLVIRSDV